MTISFTIPGAIERLLTEHGQDPSAAAKEAAMVELYRQAKLTRIALSQALGLSRFETEGVLKRHNVIEDLQTPAEYEADLDTVRRSLGS